MADQKSGELVDLLKIDTIRDVADGTAKRAEYWVYSKDICQMTEGELASVTRESIIQNTAGGSQYLSPQGPGSRLAQATSRECCDPTRQTHGEQKTLR